MKAVVGGLSEYTRNGVEYPTTYTESTYVRK